MPYGMERHNCMLGGTATGPIAQYTYYKKINKINLYMKPGAYKRYCESSYRGTKLQHHNSAV